jgi:cobalt/nickel transport system permease protein
MTHIMVPDGVLAPWLWLSGWVAAAAGLALALWATRDSDRARLVPLAAVLAGVMALVMSLGIAPLAYEPHLTALAGIMLGPAYGFLAVFVFNVLRMLLGDGGVTLLGLNTVLLGIEAIVAYYIFRAVAHPLAGRGPVGAGIAALVATEVALGVATLAFLAAVAAGASELKEVGEEVLERLGGAEPEFATYAAWVLRLGAIGWTIEGVIVGAIVAFLRAVRPALIPVPNAAPANPAPSYTAPAHRTRTV